MVNLLAMDTGSTIGVVCGIVVGLVLVMLLLVCLVRYKKCPSDKIMVIYGKVSKNKDGTGRSAKCIHGGAALVVPFFQSYTFLDLTPLSISVDLKNALSKQNIRIDVPSVFTVGISTDPAIMQNAAERLLGLQLKQISELAKDVISVAEAESMAIEGENKAKADIAQSKATLRQREAEAMKLAVTAENVQAAKAKEESYAAEQAAEVARASREKATKEADVIVASEIEKRKIEIEADAEAENIRRRAKGEADAIYARMEAEARGVLQTLSKQAEGMQKLVKAAGSADEAVRLMIADKLEELVAKQVEAIKNIKIDKITVWDGGQNAEGKTATANFLSGMLKSLPPLDDLYGMAGLKMPKIISPETVEEDKETAQVPAETPSDEAE